MFLEDQLMKFKITETEPLPDLNTQPYQIPPKSIILNACDTNGNCFDDFIALYPRAHGNLSQWCEYSPHSLSKLAWQASRLGTTYLVPPPEPFPDSPFDWDSDFTRSGSEEHKQHYIAYLFTSKGRGFNVSSAPCEVLANTKIALADLERQLGMKFWVDFSANDSGRSEIYTVKLNSAFGVLWGETKRILEHGGYAMTVARLDEKHKEILCGDCEFCNSLGPTFSRRSPWYSEYEKTTSREVAYRADLRGTDSEQNSSRTGDKATMSGQKVAVGDEYAAWYDVLWGLKNFA